MIVCFKTLLINTIFLRHIVGRRISAELHIIALKSVLTANQG